jgi:uncharacterized SAM-binding protein YcdF (DUF218 family)
MFFYVSKVVWFFAQPSGLLLLVLIVGSALLFTRHQVAGRRLVLVGTGIVLIGGLLPLSTWLIIPLENRFPRADLSGKEIDGMIVLGGVEDSRVAAQRHTHAFNEAGERLTEVVALARRFPNAKIVFAGGSNAVLSRPTIGAEAAGQVLQDLGIADRLILERRSRDTWENALFTKALLDPQPGERWLLLTSGWHMPRAMGVFRKVGFEVEPWPVDYRTASDWDALWLFDAPAEGLKRLDTVVREWVGLLVYRLTGRTDELVPGPR